MLEKQDVDTSICPVIYGNEIETSVAIQKAVNQFDDLFPDDERFSTRQTIFVEPRNVRAFIPKALRAKNTEEWLMNGFRVYDAISSFGREPSKIEIATPECGSIEELVVLTRAADLILVEGSRELLERSKNKNITGIRLQKRVIDSVGNTWGMHDNYGLEEKTKNIVAPKLVDYLSQFVASRCFITGAGMFADGKYKFSQKLENTNKDHGYGYFGRHFRDASSTSEDVKRIEVSSGDPNISDWATTVRIGSVALLFTVLASGQEGDIDRYFEDGSDYDTKNYARDRNQVHYSSNDENLKVTIEQLRSVGMQRAVAETFLDKVVPRAGQDTTLIRVANEIISFCDDFVSVSEGSKSLSVLSDRADWAARMVACEARAKKGISREVTDLNYDATLLTKSPDGGVLVSEGIGNTMRTRKKYKITLPQKKIEHYLSETPDTRAKVRAELLKTGKVSSVDWDYVSMMGNEGKTVKIQLPNATSSIVTDLAQRFIES